MISKKEKRFQVILMILMTFIILITLYPVWYSVINSLNHADDIAKNGFATLLPRQFSLESWKSVLKNPDIFRAFGITLLQTLIVTVLQTLITAMFSYGFSKPNLMGKKFYQTIGMISMYLNGGVIAYFILFNALGIYDTFWVYVFPMLFGGFYNVIIFNSNFKEIPASLYESAKIDGANEYTIFFKVVMPLSKAVISALGLFTAVAVWNNYTQALYYTKSPELQTLSYYMLSITKSSQSAEQLGETMSAGASSILTTISSSAANYKTIELACMVLASLPLVIIYPFVQKFFEKGIMVGSIKG